MVVMQMLEELRDEFDRQTGKIVSGSATITNPSTSVVVTHGLGQASYVAIATPKADPVNRYWISNKTDVQFQLNVNVTPAGSLSFDWLVKGD
jgi:hypothetical protein